DDEPVDLHFHQGVGLVHEFVRVSSTMCDQGTQSASASGCFNAADNLCVVGVADVVEDDAQNAGLIGNQAARRRVQPVAQLLGRLQDPVAFFLADTCFAA